VYLPTVVSMHNEYKFSQCLYLYLYRTAEATVMRLDSYMK